MENTELALKKATELFEDLKGIVNSDAARENVEKICDTVLEALLSVIGVGNEHLWHDHETEIIEFWKEVKNQVKNIKL